MQLIEDKSELTKEHLKKIASISEPETLVRMLGKVQHLPGECELLIRGDDCFHVVGPRQTIAHAIFEKLIKLVGKWGTFKVFQDFIHSLDLHDGDDDFDFLLGDCDFIFSAELDRAKGA